MANDFWRRNYRRARQLKRSDVKRWLEGPVFDWIVRLAVLASAIMLFVVSNSASNTSDCLRTFIQNQGVATQAQAKASTEDRQVIDDLINDFIHSRSRADAIKALNDYVAARAKNDKLRAAHPVPSSRGVCS